MVFLSFKRWQILFALALVAVVVWETVALGEVKVPNLQLSLNESDKPGDVVPALKIVILLTVLSVAPAILLMMTSFTRILIVLGFVRQALGTQTMPPNQVLLGLALFLTMFTMAPIWGVIEQKAVNPYISNQINQEQALHEIMTPLRKFMLHETRKDDLDLFINASGAKADAGVEEVPFTTLMPAFMISELKTAFQIGFLVYVPFLIIDMVISSILMAMGMMMLPPTVVSLPFKLVLFVLVDGWSLIVSSVMKSFQIFA